MCVLFARLVIPSHEDPEGVQLYNRIGKARWNRFGQWLDKVFPDSSCAWLVPLSRASPRNTF